MLFGFFFLTENLKMKKGRLRFEFNEIEACTQFRIMLRALSKALLWGSMLLLLDFAWSYLPFGNYTGMIIWLILVPLLLIYILLHILNPRRHK